MRLPSGQRLGPYEVVALIGVGGMGEVYKARDTRLDRTVAIKVLPAHVAADRESRERLEREARAISSLNHPHICTLHDVGHDGGMDFLVMEYIDGDTLAEKIKQGPLAVGEAIRLVRQIAEALEAAHERGMVHRDLKPANIKIAPDGQVKVLDFGLAKAGAGGWSADLANSPTFTGRGATEAGVILGTAAYMSPEQARGHVVDKRTDIWAYGCVCYEALTGRQAFAGETVTDVLAAIVKNEPDWSALPADTPAALRRTLSRCLKKDLKERARDIADVRLDLDEALNPVDVATAQPAPVRVAGWKTASGVVLVGALAAVAAFVAGAQWSASREALPAEWMGEFLGGSTIALGPVVSPDGKNLAFQAMVDNLTQVAVMRPETGNWQVLTRDRSRSSVQDICWSPDGTRIYFDRVFGGPRGVFSVPMFGGEERLVLEDASGPRALPDGSLLVTRINADRAYQLHRFWPETGTLEPLGALLSTSGLLAPLRVFPDGHGAVFHGTPAAAPESREHLYTIDLASGATRRLAPTVDIPRPTFGFPLAVTPDGGSVLFDLPAGNLHQIVAVPRDGSDHIQPLITLTSRPFYLDAGPDGSLYLDQTDQPTEILRYAPSDGRLERLPLSGAYEQGSVRPLADGRLLVPMRASGRTQVMVMGAGRDPVPFVQTTEETHEPMTVLGNDRVALLLGSSGNRSIAIVSVADGRIVGRMGRVRGDEVLAMAGSPDGRTLFYVVGGDVWAVPAEDGEPRRVHAGDSVAVDPGGQYLVALLSEKEAIRLVRVSMSGGADQVIPLDPQGDLRLAPAGQQTLAPNAVAADGRLAVRIVSKDLWYWPAAILDARTGRLERMRIGFEADMPGPGWDREGRLVTISSNLRSSLWRFRPVTPKP